MKPAGKEGNLRPTPVLTVAVGLVAGMLIIGAVVTVMGFLGKSGMMHGAVIAFLGLLFLGDLILGSNLPAEISAELLIKFLRRNYSDAEIASHRIWGGLGIWGLENLGGRSIVSENVLTSG